MNVGSLFSGIGGLDHGLARAGFRHAFLCESDPWRRSVLAQHFPGVPIYEDVRQVDATAWAAWVGLRRRKVGGTGRAPTTDAAFGDGSGLDLLCGGFPCQDVSVAGRRTGLAGKRSGLFYEFARIAESLRPRFLLVENVPGLLSSNGGRDFGAVLGTLADIGYGLAWRILDSRYFGVPQRRRRVFVLGALADGDPRGAAERCGEVLAVGTRCERHPAAGTEARTDAPTASANGAGDGGWINSGAGWWDEDDGAAMTLSQRDAKDTTTLVTAFHPTGGGAKGLSIGELAPSGVGAAGMPAISSAAGVRRLTPTECERLQSLPDGWTGFGPDSRRYAALGDAVTASVAEWIGHRLIHAGVAA